MLLKFAKSVLDGILNITSCQHLSCKIITHEKAGSCFTTTLFFTGTAW